MSNAIVDLRFTLNVPESIVESVAGRADDGSDGWMEKAWSALEEAVKDDTPRFMEYVIDEPDVEVTM